MMFAIFLTLGGNDFLQKYYSFTHTDIAKKIIQNSNHRENLLRVDIQDGQFRIMVNMLQLVRFLKYLFRTKLQ